LRLHGSPLKPEDLASHSLIRSSAGSAQFDWKFSSGSGLQALRLQARLTVTTNDAALEAAVRGLGITRLLSYQIAPQVAAGELDILLEDFELAPIPIHILHREARLATVKVRTFIDFIASRLRADPALNYL
jgi:DNA-binding transcriptional LysR family regulator